ncbi:MAG: Methylated-DNA--protein-cysteine methyltransferase [Chlamydiales bacterium]|nr:Methylated-DNA--protein-cysteine methyltransferase [Chlamydiales bacterium]
MKLTRSYLETPLGQMIAIADERVLYLLEFVDRRGLEREIKQLQKTNCASMIFGSTSPICLIERDLERYFAGELREFATPFHFVGSDFQKSVWTALTKIPYGESRAYSDIAQEIGKPKAYRAVASAIAANQLALIVPCHRVIHADGSLSDYSSGPVRKKRLLELEKC